MEWLWCALLIQLKGIGIENGVTPEVIEGAMKARRAVLEDDVHRAASHAPVLRVEGDGHHLELLHRVDARRDVPGAGRSAALNGDGRAIQQELIGGTGLAGDGVGVRCIPSAGAGVATGAELRV